MSGPRVLEDKKRLLDELDEKRRSLAEDLERLAEQHQSLPHSATDERMGIEARMEEIQGFIKLLNQSALPIYRASEEDFHKSVFISYTGDKHGRDRLKLATETFEQAHYRVRTGFERQREAFVIDNIADLIGRSSVFLALWTMPDSEINPTTSSRGSPPPGYWLPLELGIAIALRKPFRIVVDHRIDRQWYLKPLRGVIHTVYDLTAVNGEPRYNQYGNFAWAIEQARIALDQRIEERLFSSTGADLAGDADRS